MTNRILAGMFVLFTSMFFGAVVVARAMSKKESR